MNRKNLPKAIMRTADSMRQALAPSAETEGVDGLLLPEIFEPCAPAPARNDAPLEHASAPAPVPPAETRSPRVSVPAPAVPNARQRRRRAEAIVERYANYAALGGFVPLPLINVASITAIILRMVKALSDLYGVRFEAERARGSVLGLIGGLTPTAASTLTISSLFYVVPGANLLGIATASIAASACARKIGWIFIRHFESGAPLVDRPVSEAGKYSAVLRPPWRQGGPVVPFFFGLVSLGPSASSARSGSSAACLSSSAL